MTKFEEELNKIEVEVQTPLEKYIVEKAVADESLYAQHYEAVLEKFKDWHSDEEFQAEKDSRKKEYEIHQDIYSKTSKKLNEAELEITNLKSQLQQQALPVVPELTQKQADTLNAYKNGSASLAIYLLTEIKKRDYDYFARAWLDGYRVGKPKLFYLKNKLTGLYLYNKPLGGYGEESASSIKNLTDDFKFTQKEIDRMDVQSYDKEDEYKGE